MGAGRVLHEAEADPAAFSQLRTTVRRRTSPIRPIPPRQPRRYATIAHLSPTIPHLGPALRPQHETKLHKSRQTSTPPTIPTPTARGEEKTVGTLSLPSLFLIGSRRSLLTPDLVDSRLLLYIRALYTFRLRQTGLACSWHILGACVRAAEFTAGFASTQGAGWTDSDDGSSHGRYGLLRSISGCSCFV